MPETLRLPARGDVARARHAIDDACAGRGVCQLVIDVPQLIAAGGPDLARLERILRYARRRQAQGQLEFESIASLAARLTCPRRRTVPARSILRPAS